METAPNHSFWDFKGEVEFIDKWFLMTTPVPVLSTCLFYLAFVVKMGPFLMKNRPAFNLNKLLILYNVIQVITSLAISSIGVKLLQSNGILSPRTCIEDDEELMMNIATATYYYLVIKLSELLDTVFFVLRKNDRQITFLHVYHHTIMVLVTWFTLKYEPTYATIFLGTVNSLVHIFMYSYYALSAIPELSKYLWWKKYLTSMQLVQFLLVVFQTFVNYKQSPCQTSYIMFTVIFFNAFVFIYLFSDFYLKAYSKKKDKSNGNTGGVNGASAAHLKHKKEFNNNITANGNTYKTKQI